jgi:hypothetical protein
MHAYTTAGWEELFLAEAGASAALAGEAVLLLVAVLIVSTLMLVPNQPRVALSAELLVTGLLAWSILVVIHTKAVRGRIGPSRAVLVGRVVMAKEAQRLSRRRLALNDQPMVASQDGALIAFRSRVPPV